MNFFLPMSDKVGQSLFEMLYLCFAPSRTDVNNLSSKMLKKKASFMNVKDLLSAAKSAASSSTPSGTDTPSGGTDTPSGDGSGGGSDAPEDD